MRKPHVGRGLFERAAELVPFPLDAAQNGVDETGAAVAGLGLGGLDRFMNRGVVLLVIHEEKLVKTEKHAGMEGVPGLARCKSFPQKVQRAKLANHAVDGFHDKRTVARDVLNQPVGKIAGFQPARDRARGKLPRGVRTVWFFPGHVTRE